MASNIKFKRSAVQNRVPTTAQLELGELALNTYDGKLYTEKNSGSAAVVEIGSILSSLVVDGDNGGGNGDVTFHGATAGRDITWDASSNSLVFADNAIAYYGSDNDLNMYHTGSHGYIKNTTGTLYIQDDTNVIIGSVTGSETGAKYIKDGALELYHNNNLRLATTDDGADISGTGSLKLPVGTTAQRSGSAVAGDLRYNSTLGAFEGYSSGWGELGGSGIGIGSTSVNPGSGVVGDLVGVGYTTINFVGAGLSVTGYGTTIVVDLGGAVSRKYGRKIHAYTATANQTTFAGLSYTNAAAQISVYLNGAKLSAATYTATSGNTVVLGTGASVGDEVEIICIDSGVDLTRNVTSYTATANQTAFTGLGYSDGGDLDVYLNGIRLAQSDYTANNGTSLTLATGASVGDLLEVVDMGQGAQWSSGFGADPDDIYRLNGGVGIGTTNPTDKLNIVGNVEILGILTATTFSGVDTDKIEEGNSSVEVIDSGSNGKVALTVDGAEKYRFTDGSLNFASGTVIRMTGISGGTGGGLHLDGAGNNGRIAVFGNSGTLSLLHSTASADTNMGVFNKGGSVDLYHNGSKKFETAAYGVNVTGTIDTDGIIVSGISTFSEDVKFIGATSGRDIVWDKSNDYLMVKDNARIVFGNGGDLSIRHLSSNNTSYVSSTTNNVIHEFNVGKDWTLQTTGADKRIHCPNNGTSTAVELYHNGSKKIETTSSGVSITGSATVSSNLTVTGNATIQGVLTYDDVTNIDSVGIVTVRSGGYLDVRTGTSINTNATGGYASGTLHKNTNSGEFAIVSGGTGGANHMTFYTSASAAPTEKLRIKSDGKVNITPGGAISGTHPPGDLNIVGTNFLTMTPNVNANASDNEVLGQISFLPYAAGTVAGASAKIEAVADSGQSGSANPTLLKFYTKPSSTGPGSSGVERLRIAANGNVSIGGGDPTPSVSGYNKATLHLMQSNSGTSVGCQLKFTINALGHNANDGGFISYWGDKNFYYNNKENLGKHLFFVTNNSGTGYEKLQIADDAVYVTGHFEATTKSFIIDHPTKENHKLRYACLEGPENSVYVRGRTKDGTIDLPDYWTGLVDEDSITVNLTPIGNKRVWVDSINNNSVNIASDDDIDCFYTVFAERKDVEKLVVEEEK